MPLSATVLSTAIQGKLNAYTTGNVGDIKKFSDDLADVLVAHIKDNLTITVPIGSVIITVTPPAGGVINPAPISCGVL